jgi:hypothetical protein
MRPCQNRDTEQKGIFRLAQNGRFVIREEQIIDELDFESSLQQRGCETKQG